MVLFLFVIMLLDLKEEERRKIKIFGRGRWHRLRSARSSAIFLSMHLDGNPGANLRPHRRLKARPLRSGKLLFTQLPVAV